MGDKLKVLVVDDSLLYRKFLTEAVEATELGEVVDTAPDGRVALEKLKEVEDIDVILLDVYMPNMNGIELLNIVAKDYPEKIVIMISGGSADSAQLTVKALELGAMDFILKPSGDDLEKNMERIKSHLHVLFAQILTRRYSEKLKEIAEKTKDVSKIKDRERDTIKPQVKRERVDKAKTVKLCSVDVIVVAASTGGPSALEKVLMELPSDIQVPILIVQHMPPTFTKMLADTLNEKTDIFVREAKEGDEIEAGLGLIAPGGYHMVVKAEGTKKIIGIEDTCRIHGVKPAADVLFESVADSYMDCDVLAIILTGMGVDGTQGVRALKSKTNCYCITQSEDSCVVSGMPKSVYEAGLSDEVVHIDKIGKRIIDIISGRV